MYKAGLAHLIIIIVIIMDAQSEAGFYLTLPSNASLDVFPKNTTSQFRVNLAQHLDLEGPWEVALTEISYLHTWYDVNEQQPFFFEWKDAWEPGVPALNQPPPSDQPLTTRYNVDEPQHFSEWGDTWQHGASGLKQPPPSDQPLTLGYDVNEQQHFLEQSDTRQRGAPALNQPPPSDPQLTIRRQEFKHGKYENAEAILKEIHSCLKKV